MTTKTARLEAVPFTFPIQLLKAAEENGEFHIVGYAATSDLDLQGDIISPEALQASSLDLLQNSTVLLNHDLTLPIGKVVKVQFDEHGLLIDALISQTEPEIIQKIKEGVLNKFSIRGQVLERERKFVPELSRAVNVILRMTLVEVSLVSVPANPEARAIGWYVSKALSELDQKFKGGISMSEEQVVVEEMRPEAEVVPQAAATAVAVAEAPKPEAPNSEAAQPAAAPAAQPAAPATEAQKALAAPVMAQLAPVWALLDQIAALGGEAAPLAEQVRAMVRSVLMSAQPHAAPKSVSKDELGKMIAGEVRKQIETALKAIPTARKGLVQPAPEADEARKQFEGLSPEKKLKVALALQQA